MKEFFKKYVFSWANLFFALIFMCFLFPSRYAQEMRLGLKSPLVFALVLVLIEAGFVAQLRRKEKARSAKDIMTFVYAFLFAWELLVSRLNLFPYVFVPAPENVFYVFVSDTRAIMQGFCSSMFLILIGMTSAVILSVVLGTFVGWSPRLAAFIYPVAKAISTVPALIYTPYIVLILPTFKLASLTVIFLSVFWGAFMASINNTAFVEKRIVNSARVLVLSTPTILFRVIIPFNFPRVVNSLPIYLSTALMTLTVAEMLGADAGMGFYVRMALSFSNYTKAIAGIIFIGLVVTVLNGIIDALKRRLIKWSY